MRVNLIEIAAGWSILLVGTGIYLWWPRSQTVGLSACGNAEAAVFLARYACCDRQTSLVASSSSWAVTANALLASAGSESQTNGRMVTFNAITSAILPAFGLLYLCRMNMWIMSPRRRGRWSRRRCRFRLNKRMADTHIARSGGGDLQQPRTDAGLCGQHPHHGERRFHRSPSIRMIFPSSVSSISTNTRASLCWT